MSTDGVQIEISAQDAGASAEFSDVLARIQGIEQELNKLSAAGKGAGESIAGGARGAGQAAEEAHGHVTTFSKGVQELADHGLMAARGLDVLGLDANAAAVKVAGLADVLGRAGEAVPALIAAGVAIAGIGVAFAFIHDAVDAAGALDSQMTLLGQTIKDQGGDWGVLQGQIQDFAELQERTTTNSVLSVVTAIKTLTASGMDAADAMKTVRIAEDAAAATGKSLQDVVLGLMEAEHGRTQILATLGIATRAQIHDGMSYNEVLGLIEKSMGGSAEAAANTYQGALAQLHNAFENLQESVGGAFLPAIKAASQGVTDIVRIITDDANPTLGEWKDWFTTHGPEIRQKIVDIFNAFVDFAKEVKDDVGPAVKHLFDALGDLAHSITDTGTSIEDGSSSRDTLKNDLIEIAKATGQVVDQIAAMVKAINDNKQSLAFFGVLIASTKLTADSLWTNADPNVVGPDQAQVDRYSRILSGTPDPTVYGGSVDGLQLGASGPSGLNFGGKYTPTPYVYTPPVKTKDTNPASPDTSVSTTIGGPQSTTAPSWVPPEIPGLGSGASKGPDSIVSGQKELDQAIKAITESETAYKNAVELATTSDAKYAAQSALNAKEESDRKKIINDLAYAISEEKRQGEELTTQLHADQAAHASAVAALKEYETELGSAGPKTAAQKQQLKDYEEAVKASNTAIADDSKKIDENTNNLVRNTDAWHKNLDAIDPVTKAHAAATLAFSDATKSQQQAMQDVIGTYGQSEAAQRAYWAQQLAIAQAGGDQMEARAAEAQGKLEALDETDYKARIDLHTQFMDTIQSQEENWIDNFVKGGMSLKDQLKQIWTDILDDFLKMLEEMIVKSAAFGQGSGSGGGLLGSILSAVFGGGGPTASIAGDPALSPFMPSGVGSAADLITTADGKAQLTHITGFSPGAFFGTPAAPAAGAFLAAAAGGAIIGGAIGNAEGAGTGAQQTHAENGAIGGAIGGAAALLLAGPAGWAAIAAMVLGGAILGGAAGGLIGPHWGPETNYPDRSDTQHYGQFVSDINGWSGTFNGTTINPDAQYNSSTGGQSLSSQLEAWENNTSATANLTDAQKATVDQLKALGDNISIASEKDGMFTLGDGTKISVTDYENLVSQIQDIRNGQAATGAGSPTFYASRTYPDFNLPTITDANGNVIVAPWGTGANPGPPPKSPVGTGDPNAPGGGTGDPGGGTNPPAPRQPPGGGPIIQITIQGNLVGTDGMNELTQIISTGLGRLNSGQIAGGYASSLAGRTKTKFS